MRSYGKVETGFWRRPKVRLLSKDARHLLLYLIACPHGNAIGCFELDIMYVKADLEWASETLPELFTELFRNGFVERHEPSGTTRIVGWWGHNKVENLNVAISVAKMAASMPVNEVSANAINDLIPLLQPFPKAFETHLKPFLNRFETLSKPSPTPEPEPEPKPEPSLAHAHASAREAPTTEPDSAALCSGSDNSEKPAVALIALFDQAIVDVFGPEHRRAFPRANDLLFARRWADARLDHGLAAAMFRDAQSAKHKAGEPPITSLKYFDTRVSQLLAAKPATPLRRAASPEAIARAVADAEIHATARRGAD